MPQHKSCKKRLRTAEKARVRNRAVRSAIRSNLKSIREADKKETVLELAPKLYSMMDKAVLKGRAGFTKNKVANYKSKVSAIINSFE